ARGGVSLLDTYVSGLDNAVGVKALFPAPQDRQRGAVLARGVASVAEPHAVLARARAAEPQRLLDERGARRLGTGALRRVRQHQRVQDPDPRVAEEVDREGAFGRDALAVRDQRGQRTDRERE